MIAKFLCSFKFQIKFGDKIAAELNRSAFIFNFAVLVMNQVGVDRINADDIKSSLRSNACHVFTIFHLISTQFY